MKHAPLSVHRKSISNKVTIINTFLINDNRADLGEVEILGKTKIRVDKTEISEYTNDEASAEFHNFLIKKQNKSSDKINRTLLK